MGNGTDRRRMGRRIGLGLGVVLGVALLGMVTGCGTSGDGAGGPGVKVQTLSARDIEAVGPAGFVTADLGDPRAAVFFDRSWGPIAWPQVKIRPHGARELPIEAWLFTEARRLGQPAGLFRDRLLAIVPMGGPRGDDAGVPAGDDYDGCLVCHELENGEIACQWTCGYSDPGDWRWVCPQGVCPVHPESGALVGDGPHPDWNDDSAWGEGDYYAGQPGSGSDEDPQSWTAADCAAGGCDSSGSGSGSGSGGGSSGSSGSGPRSTGFAQPSGGSSGGGGGGGGGM